MKYVFDKNGIVNSENTERLVQYSVNANELQVAFTDLNIKEYVPYVAFERADGKVSPLIGMAFTEFELNGTKYSGASYSFSDSWVTAQSGILKVAIILKKNNVNARTSTFNLNVAESISEDKVNYIEDVAYNELVGRVYQLEQKQQDIINGDLSVGVADKAHSDYFGHEFTEHYETKIGATEKVNELKRKVENGEVIGYGAHRDGVGNNIVATYETKEDATNKLNEAKQYANSIKPKKVSDLTQDINYALKEELPTKTSDLTQDINYALKEELPTKTSDLTNDSDYVSSTVNNLVNYYLKTDTFTKDEVRTLIAGVSTLDIRVVPILPTENISNTTIYLLETNNTEENNVYEEYIYANNRWEVIGTTKIDLSEFALKDELDLVDKDVQDNYKEIVKLDRRIDTLEEKQVTKLSDLKNDIKLLNKDGNIVAYKPIEMGLYNFTNGYFYFIPDFKNLVTYDSVENCSFYDSLGNQYTQLQTIAGKAENSSGKVFNTAVVYGIDINGVKHLLMGANAENKQITGYATDVDYYIKFTDTSEFNINSIIRLITLCVQYDEDVVYKEVASKEYVDNKSGGAANINVAVKPKTLIGKWNIYKNFDNVKYPEFGIKKRINFKDSDNRQFIGINITHAYYIDENHTYGYSRIYAAYDETTFESGIGILILNTEDNTGMCLENGEFKKDYYLIFEIDDNEIMQKLQPVAVKIENNSNANLVSVDFIEDKLGNIESILDTLNGEVV